MQQLGPDRQWTRSELLDELREGARAQLGALLHNGTARGQLLPVRAGRKKDRVERVRA